MTLPRHGFDDAPDWLFVRVITCGGIGCAEGWVVALAAGFGYARCGTGLPRGGLGGATICAISMFEAMKGSSGGFWVTSGKLTSDGPVPTEGLGAAV